MILGENGINMTQIKLRAGGKSRRQSFECKFNQNAFLRMANITATWSSKIVARMLNEIKRDGFESLATATKRLPLKLEVDVKGKVSEVSGKNLLTRSEGFFLVSIQFTEYVGLFLAWLFGDFGAEMYADMPREKNDQIAGETNFPRLSWSVEFMPVSRGTLFPNNEIFFHVALGSFRSFALKFEISLCSQSIADVVSSRSKKSNGLTNFRSMFLPAPLRHKLEFIDPNGPFRHS